MTNQTVLQAIDAVAPDAPLVPILTVCGVLDQSRTNSVESVVEEIKRLMVLSGTNPCEILSALVNDTLLSDDADPCHVYGLDFIKACDKAMCGNHE